MTGVNRIAVGLALGATMTMGAFSPAVDVYEDDSGLVFEAELPGGIRVETGPEGVRLAGRGLVRRILLDPRLRALMAEVVK